MWDLLCTVKNKQHIIYKYKYRLWVAGAFEITLQHFSPVAETFVNYAQFLNWGSKLGWNIWELTHRRRRPQRVQQKSIRVRLAKQLSTCITLFCTFLRRRCTTTKWKCLISTVLPRTWTKTTTIWLFLFLKKKIQSFCQFANIWRFERVGISTIKFEVARIHFLSDIFVDVAFVVNNQDDAVIFVTYASCRETEDK